MRIAVSMRVTSNTGYYEPRDAISHDWIVFFDRYGITPVLVPNGLRDPVEFTRSFDPKGLLLTGGNDLGSLGRTPDDRQPGADVSDERDRTERALLSAAIDDSLPVFGVCRGMQLINLHFGGRLRRNLAEFGNHVATDHPVEFIGNPLKDPERLRQTEMNSFHNNAVAMDDLGGQLIPFAVADRVVEGVYHPDLPITAVQWHPERPNPGAALDELLIGNWLRQCA